MVRFFEEIGHQRVKTCIVLGSGLSICGLMTLTIVLFLEKSEFQTYLTMAKMSLSATILGMLLVLLGLTLELVARLHNSLGTERKIDR